MHELGTLCRNWLCLTDKYCIKFINNTPCRKDNCPNQHQWCSPNDIVARPAKTKADSHSEPNKASGRRLSHAHSQSASQSQSQSQLQLQAERDQDKQAKWAAMGSLQRRFSDLQTQFSRQNSVVQVLLQQVNQLKLENEVLRVENHKMVGQGQGHQRELDADLNFASMAELVDSVIVDDHDLLHTRRTQLMHQAQAQKGYAAQPHYNGVYAMQRGMHMGGFRQ